MDVHNWMTEWDPVTVVVLVTGHQVHCIFWVQVPILNKGIEGIKILYIDYILWRILTTKSMFDVANILKDLLSEICQ